MKYVVSDNKIILNHPLDYEAILTCGQIFRFKEVGGEYEVISGRHRCVTRGNEIECDDANYFVDFFDLDEDYDRYMAELSHFDELRAAMSEGSGIRILRQDLFEMIISFIVSANNNIPRIKGIIERICDFCGSDMGEYRAFPTPSQLKSVSVEEFRSLGAGYRDKYLHDTAEILAETDFLTKLKTSDTARAQKMLISLPGIGPKVADCILMFGLRKWDCFPVDTWIFKVCGNEELDSPQKVREFYLNRYGAMAGLAQQYIFYDSRKNKVFRPYFIKKKVGG